MKSRQLKTSDVEAHLISTLRVRFGVSPDPSVELTSIGIDSLAMADLITELEDEFDVRVDQDIFEVETISALAIYIKARRSVGR